MGGKGGTGSDGRGTVDGEHAGEAADRDEGIGGGDIEAMEKRMQGHMTRRAAFNEWGAGTTVDLR
eukprot:3819901-Pleurochrysis_carterae.AAC.1